MPRSERRGHGNVSEAMRETNAHRKNIEDDQSDLGGDTVISPYHIWSGESGRKSNRASAYDTGSRHNAFRRAPESGGPLTDAHGDNEADDDAIDKMIRCFRKCPGNKAQI